MFDPTEAPPVADRLESGAVRHGRPSEDDIAAIVADGRVRDMLAEQPDLSPLDIARARHGLHKSDMARLFGVPLFLVQEAERKLSSRERLAMIAALDAAVPHINTGARILRSWLPRRGR